MRHLTALLLGVVLLASCGQAAADGYARYQFRCCAQAQLTTGWHPGGEVVLHWNVTEASRTADDTAHPVILSALLTGPYNDPTSAKQNRGSTEVVQGPIGKTNDRSPTPQVTDISLPGDLPVGYYRLTTSADLGGGTSITDNRTVQVTAR